MSKNNYLSALLCICILFKIPVDNKGGDKQHHKTKGITTYRLELPSGQFSGSNIDDKLQIFVSTKQVNLAF